MCTDSAEVVDRRESKAGVEYYVHYVDCESYISIYEIILDPSKSS